MTQRAKSSSLYQPNTKHLFLACSSLSIPTYLPPPSSLTGIMLLRPPPSIIPQVLSSPRSERKTPSSLEGNNGSIAAFTQAHIHHLKSQPILQMKYYMTKQMDVACQESQILRRKTHIGAICIACFRN